MFFMLPVIYLLNLSYFFFKHIIGRLLVTCYKVCYKPYYTKKQKIKNNQTRSLASNEVVFRPIFKRKYDLDLDICQRNIILKKLQSQCPSMYIKMYTY